MDITVVTPTHNKLNLLQRTLNSLAKQETTARFEVVVVDDGSTDETPAFLGGFKAPYPLKVVRVNENKGRSAARNRGLEKADGDLVVFLDDDMELVPEFLESHFQLHQGSGSLGGVGNVINHPEITMAPIDRYMSTRGAQKVKSQGVLPWKYFSTNNSSVKRADLEAVGGFDENFIWYGFEDLELAWRLEKERKVTLHFVDGARSLHIHPHTLQEVLDKKELAGRSSMPYMFQKYPETRAAMGFDKYELPRFGDGPIGLNLKRLVYRAILNPVVYHLVKPLAKVNLGGLTYLAIDYLVLYHYIEGMKEARRQQRERGGQPA